VGGVLVGFAVILTVIAAGYLLGRLNIVTPTGVVVLGKVAFYAATPALLFTVMAKADIHVLLSPVALVGGLSLVAAALVYLALSRLFFRRPVAETTLGMATASYVNANNIGLPVAIYVIGDAQYAAPVLLIQLLFAAPALLSVLDLSTRGRLRPLDIVLMPVRNPIIVAVVLGLLVAILGIQLPDAVVAPFDIVGGAAVPLMLLAFGASLRGNRPLAAGSDRTGVIVATAVKSLAMPVIAWIVGALVLHMDPMHLYAAVVFAALPTAQNMYNYAQRFEVAVATARDTVLLTTVVSLPVIFAIAALLAH